MTPYIPNVDTLSKQVGSFTPLPLDLYLKNAYLNFRPLPLNFRCLQFNVKFCRLCVRACVWCGELRGEVRTLYKILCTAIYYQLCFLSVISLPLILSLTIKFLTFAAHQIKSTGKHFVNTPFQEQAF